MSLRLRVWLLWRRLRVALLALLGRGEMTVEDLLQSPVGSGPLAAIKRELVGAAHRVADEEALGIPQAGVDYELVDLTPELQARSDRALGELMAYQDRRRATRVRVRRARLRTRLVVAGAATLLMLLMVAGAGAFGLRLGLLDRVADIASDREAAQEERPDRSGDIHIPGPYPDIRPAPGERTEKLEVPLTGGDKKAELVAYVSSGDRICTALVVPLSKVASQPRFGCMRQEDIADFLTRKPAFWTGLQVGEKMILWGFATKEVEAIEASGPHGRFFTRITDPWMIEGDAGDLTVRVFVAAFNVDFGEDGPQTGETDPLLDFRQYELLATMDDGQVVQANP